MKTQRYLPLLAIGSLLAAGGMGCNKARPQQASAGPQALPVQTITAEAVPVPQSDEYVATIKSRNSATINPQVDGNITRILVHSGEQVRPGQTLMEIDASKQEATVASQAATADQKLALYNYDKLQVERQRKLFADGIISKDALDQAEQAYANSKADYDSAVESVHMQQKELGYYKITAPFDGIVGDVPVHVGDYVSPTTLLTTVDQNRDLEAYVYVPTERASEVRRGLPVNILDNSGNLIEKTAIDFVSPQVDDALQGILVKAPVHSRTLRNDQLVEAQVIWGTAPHPVVPVLAVSRLGGQAFVFVAQSAGAGKFIARQQAVTLGNTVGNEYAVLSGLKDGDQVIVSGTQFLVDGAPVIPLPPAPAGAAAHAGL
ncbi:MAG: efflux RND transporter periplasmic adaptor subunit [Acidobacteriaceae bacterium]